MLVFRPLDSFRRALRLPIDSPANRWTSRSRSRACLSPSSQKATATCLQGTAFAGQVHTDRDSSKYLFQQPVLRTTAARFCSSVEKSVALHADTSTLLRAGRTQYPLPCECCMMIGCARRVARLFCDYWLAKLVVPAESCLSRHLSWSKVDATGGFL